MKGFDPKFRDFPDYIIGITKEIWEDRGVATLNQYYGTDIDVRSPMGIQHGNQAVIASTMATINEFPDRELLAEDVIWCDAGDQGFLSSHRLITTATHSRDGAFGKGTGKRWIVRVIADCAAKDNIIYDEWLVRDYGGIVRQLGKAPMDYAAELIEREGGPEKSAMPFLPENDVAPKYTGTGNTNDWGKRYANSLRRIMDKDFRHVFEAYDRAILGEYAGGVSSVGRDQTAEFWIGLRSAFPNAAFDIHHQIGMEEGMLPPRAAVRWSLDGIHEGWGSFGEPTGARVHIFGMAHAEFGPFGTDGVSVRREYALYDEIAIWKQILLQKGKV